MERSETSLTIGTFDGLHLGHQAILHYLKGRRIAITFLNHPNTVLKKTAPQLLMSPDKRLSMLKREVDQVHELPFTETLSQLSAKDFLNAIRQIYPFTHLVLGHDAVIGRGREGGPEALKKISEELNFQLTYLPPVRLDSEIVSSSLIRATLATGDLNKVSRLLGRPYSIDGVVIRGSGAGKHLGYPTANIRVSELALPPLGVYAVTVDGVKAIANLGMAPTLHKERPVMLEVHLLEGNQNLYGREIEVRFVRFIREERTFTSSQALQAQIKNDIEERLSMQEEDDISILHDVVSSLCP